MRTPRRLPTISLVIERGVFRSTSSEAENEDACVKPSGSRRSVIGGGPGRAVGRLSPGTARAAVRDPRGQRARRRFVAEPLGLAAALHAGAVRRARRHAVPGARAMRSRRRTRWPTTSSRTPRDSSCRCDTASPLTRLDARGRPVRRHRRRPALRGGARRRRHGEYQRREVPRVRVGARLAASSSCTRATYRNLAQLREGRVLIVGAGNSGCGDRARARARRSPRLDVGTGHRPRARSGHRTAARTAVPGAASCCASSSIAC